MKTIRPDALRRFIFSKLKPELESRKGLFIFAQQRAKFEGWLKVELCDLLSERFDNVKPEHSITKKKRVDITFEDWALELKTINTSYEHDFVQTKGRPITLNIRGVIKDAKKLKNLKKIRQRAVLFLVFPLSADNKEWDGHVKKLSQHLNKLKMATFYFTYEREKIEGALYFATVK